MLLLNGKTWTKEINDNVHGESHWCKGPYRACYMNLFKRKGNLFALSTYWEEIDILKTSDNFCCIIQMNSTHFLFRSLPRALVYTRLTVSCFMMESSPNCIPIVDQNQNPTHVRHSGVYLHKHFKQLFDRIKKFLDCRLHILQM